MIESAQCRLRIGGGQHVAEQAAGRSKQEAAPCVLAIGLGPLLGQVECFAKHGDRLGGPVEAQSVGSAENPAFAKIDGEPGPAPRGFRRKGGAFENRSGLMDRVEGSFQAAPQPAQVGQKTGGEAVTEANPRGIARTLGVFNGALGAMEVLLGEGNVLVEFGNDARLGLGSPVESEQFAETAGTQMVLRWETPDSSTGARKLSAFRKLSSACC